MCAAGSNGQSLLFALHSLHFHVSICLAEGQRLCTLQPTPSRTRWRRVSCCSNSVQNQRCEPTHEHTSHSAYCKAFAVLARTKERPCPRALYVCYGLYVQCVDMMGRVPYEMAEDDNIRVILGGPDPR